MCQLTVSTLPVFLSDATSVTKDAPVKLEVAAARTHEFCVLLCSLIDAVDVDCDSFRSNADGFSQCRDERGTSERTAWLLAHS